MNKSIKSALVAATLTIVGGMGIAKPANALNFSEPPDLSNDFMNPTVLNLDDGTNTLSGSTGPVSTDFNDLFTLTGAVPTSFVLSAYSPGPSNVSSGFRISRRSDNVQIDEIQLNVGGVGTDLMPFINATLATGSVTLSEVNFDIREGSGPSSWTFQIEAVPFEFEASVGLIALAGMFGGYTYMKKKNRKQLANKA